MDRKINHINYFNNSLGQPSKSGYVVFNYDFDGLLQESVRLDEDNVANLRFRYFYNATGQVTRRETYSVGFNDKDIVNMDNYALYEGDGGYLIMNNGDSVSISSRRKEALIHLFPRP